jgi:hypothetical protein
MAITDIDISETLEAGAPSIKYTGNRDPNQMMMTSQPNPEAEMNDLSIFFFGKSLNELTDDELEYLNIQMQDRYGSKKPGGTENILVAGGGDRGWRAQMLAEDLAQEQYGKEFYDLSQDQQMEIYNIALDMIDTGGMATGGRVGYGLGSLVKKIGKGIKKIVKSPVGKAALLTLGGAGLMGAGPLGGMLGGAGQGIAGFFGKGSFNPLKAMISSEGFTGLGPSKFGQMLGKMGTGSKVGIGTALATYLGSQGMEEEQIEEVQRDPNKLRPYLRDLFKKLNPNLPDGQIEEMVETNVSEYATGGRVGLALGSEDTAQAASILGNLPLRQNAGGITELDLRETGGFIPPVGVKEKADDVPAMLSNNEFVFTADAVRAAGGGSVNKGAQILYDKMKQLESKVV